jgi:hypothetical protein
MAHPVGGWRTVGNGNATTGNPVNTSDTIDSGDDSPPFAIGNFLWAIPHEYQNGAGAAVPYTLANHVMSATAAGAATIQKAGAGPFTKNAADPTSTY